MNPDLTVVMHRPPVSRWSVSRSISRWDSTGLGLATGNLFDTEGAVATAMQTLILQRC